MQLVPREGGGRPEKVYFAPNGLQFNSLIAVKQYLSEGVVEKPAKRPRTDSTSGGKALNRGHLVATATPAERHESEAETRRKMIAQALQAASAPVAKSGLSSSEC